MNGNLLQCIVCPNCHGHLKEKENNLICEQCNSQFSRDKNGYIEFLLDKNIAKIDTTTEEYAENQDTSGVRVYNDFLLPYIQQEQSKRLLDVGCGIGKEASLLIEAGYEAYGIDLPGLSKRWAKAGNDPGHFFICDATKLPFPDNFFDFIYSFGVIEHIGTIIGVILLSVKSFLISAPYGIKIESLLNFSKYIFL